MPPDFSVSRDDIDGITAWTVIRAAREVARRLALELAPLYLSPVEFGVLAQLAISDELSQADLARAVGVRPQSMTALITGLTNRALIDRGPERGRGRLSRIRLAPSGLNLLHKALPVVQASNAWFADGPLSPDSIRDTLQPLLGAPRRMSPRAVTG